MSTEFLKKVFLPFERHSDSTKGGIQWTGLGMSITKGFVDMMNGTIDVLSEENKGTEFIVRLQFRLADPSAANSSSEKTGTSCASSVSSIEEVENFNNTELSSHNELHFVQADRFDFWRNMVATRFLLLLFQPMLLKRIKKRLLKQEWTDISQNRLMWLNCWRHWV